MRKIMIPAVFLLVGLCLASVPAGAGPIALVYENDLAVKEGRAVVGSVTQEGVVISAKMALASPTSLLVGIPPGDLKKARLLKLDALLDMALIQPGDSVQDPELQEAYALKVATMSSFISVDPGVSPLSTAPPPALSPYQIKINGQIPGAAPLSLKAVRGRSKMKLEIVRVSTVPVWYMELEISAEPKLNFWNENKKQGLNDVPTSPFRYQQQVLFVGWGNGKGIRIPVGLYSIKEKDYVLHFRVTAKSESWAQDIPITFESK